MLQIGRRILITAAPIILLLSIIFPNSIYARSGCCSHHGGVCGCGCCDGTGLSTTCAPYYPECSQPVYVAPIKTPTPIIYTPRPTIKIVTAIAPTIKPNPTVASTPTKAPKPNPSPEVQRVSTQNTQATVSSPTPTTAPPTTGETIGVLAFLTTAIGLPIWVIVKLLKKFRKPKTEI